MKEEKEIMLPCPLIDAKENNSKKALCERYDKLVTPGVLAKTIKKASKIIPESFRNTGSKVVGTIKEHDLYNQCMEIAAKGFGVIEKQAAKVTISEGAIVKKVNDASKEVEITSIEEICLARSYDISKIVNKYRMQDLGLAFAEGGTTGYFGFAGLPFNCKRSITRCL